MRRNKLNWTFANGVAPTVHLEKRMSGFDGDLYAMASSYANSTPRTWEDATEYSSTVGSEEWIDSYAARQNTNVLARRALVGVVKRNASERSRSDLRINDKAPSRLRPTAGDGVAVVALSVKSVL
jgi:hypothetical protein